MWRDRILAILSPRYGPRLHRMSFNPPPSNYTLAIPNQKNPFTVVLLGRAMNPLSISLLLVHPILALLLIYWITIQYGWRKRKKVVPKENMESERDRHAKNGKLILWSAISISLFAMVARALSGIIENGDFTSMLMPQSLHGWTGPIGLILLGIMSKYGNQTHKAIHNKQKSGKLRMMHGRAADFIIVLGAIHAFLGFLYTFSILT